MPPLVELAVIRQKHLRHDAEQLAAVDRDRAIVEPPLPPQRRPDDEDRQAGFRLPRPAARSAPRPRRAPRPGTADRRSNRPTATARETPSARSPPRRHRASSASACVAVPRRLGDRDLRHAGADPHELVTVRGKEGRHRTGCSRFGRLIAAPIWRFANGFVRGGGRHRAVRPGAPRKRFAASALALAGLLRLTDRLLYAVGLKIVAVFTAATLSSIGGFAFPAICGAFPFQFLRPVETLHLMIVCSIALQCLSVLALRNSAVFASARTSGGIGRQRRRSCAAWITFPGSPPQPRGWCEGASDPGSVCAGLSCPLPA